ncbi:DUF6777 domain-containing protein [Streptomyces sp. NPDC005728]|uniref:DUF6777 domain-containing protein n=1 Tax=Streptomyces sp. NPDC005728 TaxID=3157054 RepID=UPI0033D962F0
MRRPRRIPAGAIVMACALSAVLVVAACVGNTVREVHPHPEVVLLPMAAPGPDPFTGSTGTTAPATRSAPSGQSVGRAPAPPPPPSLRTLSGATPGLYGGTARVSGCDVQRQIGRLAAEPAKGDAFARVAGVSSASLPGYLRGLTPVVLRVDTSVTSHAYRERQAARFPSVLQAGTAVLVDNRGVPRVRCACGNPLTPPESVPGSFGTRGAAWSGYRPGEVIVVTAAPRAVTGITIVDAATQTWIERRIGDDVRRDRVVPAPVWATSPPTGTAPPPPAGTASPHPDGTAPAPPAGIASPPPAGTAFPPPFGTAPAPPVGTATLPPAGTAFPPPAGIAPPPPFGTAPAPPVGTASLPPAGTASPPVTGPANTGQPSPDGARVNGSPDGRDPALSGDAPSAAGRTGTGCAALSAGGLAGCLPQQPFVPGPPTLPDIADEIGPPTVPEIPDLSDGGGLIPDDPPDLLDGTADVDALDLLDVGGIDMLEGDALFDGPVDAFGG